MYYGYHAYGSLAKIVKYVLHRGMIFSWMQQLFTMIYFFMNLNMFSGLLMIGYTTVFTSLPVISIMMHEQMPFENILSYPNIYRDAKTEFRPRYLLIWGVISVYQATVIFVFTIL